MDLTKIAVTQENAPEILLYMTDKLGRQDESKIYTGRSKTVKTAKGTQISASFALIDISRVIASHTATGAENPQYPQELQPRDRSRDTSQAWVQKTASNLDYESLGGSTMADRGSPIVGPDLVVESGNGRTMAIQLAYARGQADEYKQWLAEEAEYFGFSAEQVNSIAQPILVRIRNTDVDRVQFAIEANQDDKLSFTATERAKADAKRIDDNMMMLFSPSEDGDLMAVSNRKFLSEFLKKLGDTESAQYVDTTGKFTQSFVLRVKQAVFAKAYNDDRLLEMMADQSKPDLQNMINALAISAPKFIEAKAVSKLSQGHIDDISTNIVDGMEQALDQDVLNAIVEATNAILQAKQSNQDISEYVKQQGLFGDLAPGVAEIAIFIAENSRSAKKMSVFFSAMADFVEKQGLESQNYGLFGEPEPVSILDAVQHANLVYENHYKQGTVSLFDSIHDYEKLIYSMDIRRQDIDHQANQAATSPSNDLPEPSHEQKQSGDYQKGMIKIGNLTIAIENPAGSVRSGVDENGNQWENIMHHHYGYIVGSQGYDGDELDIFVKKGMTDFNGLIYVIQQINPKTKEFDEHKLVIGADSLEEAKQIYFSNYEKDWQGFKNIKAISVHELVSKLNRIWNEFDSAMPQLSHKISGSFIPTLVEQNNALNVLYQMKSDLEYSAHLIKEHGDIHVPEGVHVLSDLKVVPDNKNGLSGEYARLKPSSSRKVVDILPPLSRCSSGGF